MDYIEYLKSILENIDDSVAKLAIDKGMDALSDKQEYVLEQGISDYLMYECPNCGESISYEDMEISIDNGMCSY
jgi:protein PhnA